MVAGLVGAGEAIYGGIQANKAKKAQAALLANRPKYQINPEEYDIENQAESQASQGMGAGARQQLQNNTDRGLATNANAILMGGGDANAIGNLADKTQQGYNQNSIYDDQVRLKNLDNLQSAYARMSADKDKQWDINTNQPWKDALTAQTQQRQAGNNMMMSGISSVGSAGAGFAKALGGNSGGGWTNPGPTQISQIPTSGNTYISTQQPQQQTAGTLPDNYFGSNWGGS